MLRTTNLAVGAALLVLATGCGGGDTGGSTDEPSGSSGGSDVTRAEVRVFDPSLGTATIRGTVRFLGDPPRRRPLDMRAEKICHEDHAARGEQPLDESVVVNADGTLRNVYVFVRKGLKGWEFPQSQETITLDQKGCVYAPHVVGVQTGQKVRIRNSDPLLHNVHTFSTKNKSFNQGQPMGSTPIEKTFSKPEVISVKCDVHGWMSSYLCVTEHPYFAVTADGGTYELAHLPPGEYTIAAWHEVYPLQTVDVIVGDGETKGIDFTFQEE